jgi:hypothetical protein
MTPYSIALEKYFTCSQILSPLHSSLTYSDFMSSMSCRWEIIGLAFAFVGSGTALPCDWDTMFQLEEKPVIPRKEMGRLALSATETCLKFCNEAGVLNDVVSWLTCQHTYLTTLIHGDRGKCKSWQRRHIGWFVFVIDYRCWRALGDLSTVIFTLGLNQPSSDYDTPFWLSETRKRIMGSAYNADKQLSHILRTASTSKLAVLQHHPPLGYQLQRSCRRPKYPRYGD